MAKSKTSVEYLQVLLPRLQSLRDNSAILTDPARKKHHSNVAFQMIEDLCVSFHTFGLLELPNVLGSRERIICNQVEDMAWLVGVGMSLDTALSRVGLEWPPPGKQPPSIVRDLAKMYQDATEHRSTYSVLPTGMLLQALKPIGERACQLRHDWPQDNAAGGVVVESGSEFATRSWSLASRLGIIANIAQALTLPAAILAFGPDAAHVTKHLNETMQVMGHDTLGMAMELSREFRLRPRYEGRIIDVWGRPYG
jgi:hypothetical protein